MSKKIPIFSFVGYSGSGKTTFIEKLIKELKNRKLRVAVIKHDAHEFEIDKEGKDTWRFTQAGADIVSISSSKKTAKIELTDKGNDLENIIKDIKNVDLIITEGYRAGKAPKIGVLRKAANHKLSVSIKDLIAIVTDEEIQENIPKFGLYEIEGMADFLESYINKEEYPEWIDLEDGIDIMLNNAGVLSEDKIRIEDSLNRVLAQDIIAGMMIPPFDRSPLDGYAFKSEETVGTSKSNPKTFKIVEEIAAGDFSKVELRNGEAVKILTGAPIPKGTDAVTRYEDTDFDEHQVTIYKEFSQFENIVFEGEDVKKGDKIASKGTIITPALIGLMASLGIGLISVFSKPIITIINTGNELIEIDEELRPGKIRNSSYYTLSSYLKISGANTLNGGCAKDNVEDIVKKIKQSLTGSDMIITTGGVSVGDYDLVIDALEEMGAKILFWKVNIKPGSAVVAATLNKKMILGLSGNPGSAVICLKTLGIPYVNQISGKTSVFTDKIKVIMYKDYNRPSPGGRFLRGNLLIEDGIAYFEERGSQKNGAISSLVECDLLGIVKPGALSVKKGEIIEAYRI